MGLALELAVLPRSDLLASERELGLRALVVATASSQKLPRDLRVDGVPIVLDFYPADWRGVPELGADLFVSVLPVPIVTMATTGLGVGQLMGGEHAEVLKGAATDRQVDAASVGATCVAAVATTVPCQMEARAHPNFFGESPHSLFDIYLDDASAIIPES